MKKFRMLLLGAGLVTLAGLGCKKDDTQPLASANYTLYNYSSGSAVNAGSFTVRENSDGNASITVNLSSGYLVPGVTLKSYVVIADTAAGTEFILSNLQDIDGGSGQATTSPVVNNSTNMPVPYTELTSDKGYAVKILNNTNVQAIGVIQ